MDKEEKKGKVKRRRGRPKILTDEEILNIIEQFGEISQRKIRQLTGIKKSTLSMIIKRLHEQESVKIRYVREGKSTLSMVSLKDVKLKVISWEDL